MPLLGLLFCHPSRTAQLQQRPYGPTETILDRFLLPTDSLLWGLLRKGLPTPALENLHLLRIRQTLIPHCLTAGYELTLKLRHHILPKKIPALTTVSYGATPRGTCS